MAATAVLPRPRVRSLVGELLASTPLGSRLSPFETFGPLAAQRAAMRRSYAAAATASTTWAFESEVRRRLADFLDGVVKPTGEQILSLCNSAMLGLEARIYGRNKPVSTFVDRTPGATRSVPAAAVSPRLGEHAIRRAIGPAAVHDEGAERRSRRSAEIRSALAPFIRDNLDNGAPFRDWADAISCVASAVPGAEIAVVNGKTLIGRAVGRFTMDPAQNTTMLAKLEGEIVEQWGNNARLVYDAALRPGQPVLVDDGLLVHGRAVASCLDREYLDRVFQAKAFARLARIEADMKGTDPRKRQHAALSLDGARADVRTATWNDRLAHLEQGAARSDDSIDRPHGKVISLASRRAAKGLGGPQTELTRGPAGRGAAPLPVVHPHNVSEAIIVQTTDRPNKFEIVNRRTGRPMQIQDMAALPDGRYAVDHQYGLGIGFVDVRAGSIRHLSLAGDEQNLEGPSFVPVPGSPEPIRYALAGNIVDESRWKAAIAASKVLGVKEFEHLLAAGRIGSDEAFRYNLGAFIDRAAARRIERREEMAAGASMEFSRD